MSHQRGAMPENQKMEIAKELGVYDKVKASGWKDVSSKDCGNIVKKSIEMSEKAKNKL